MFKITTTKGFTLVELLVTVSVLVILLTIVVSGFGPAREQSRDTQRQTDLRTIEAALALYKNKYGVYPAACNGPTTGANPNWSGQIGSGYDCTSGSSQYIENLAPEFIPKLPTDPRLNSNETYSGYVYTVNDEQSVYKLMALNTVENETVEEGDPFFRCGSEFRDGTIGSGGNGNGGSYDDSMICLRVPPNLTSSYNPGGYTSPTECRDVDEYGTSYAVSDGFSNDARGLSGTSANKGREYDTEIVRCG